MPPSLGGVHAVLYRTGGKAGEDTASHLECSKPQQASGYGCMRGVDMHTGLQLLEAEETNMLATTYAVKESTLLEASMSTFAPSSCMSRVADTVAPIASKPTSEVLADGSTHALDARSCSRLSSGAQHIQQCSRGFHGNMHGVVTYLLCRHHLPPIHGRYALVGWKLEQRPTACLLRPLLMM